MFKQGLLILVLAVCLVVSVEAAAATSYEIGTPVEIASSVLGIYNPVYDSTGQKVAWTEVGWDGVEGGQTWLEIWVCDLNKPEEKTRVADQKALVRYGAPAWSPDGSYIFFTSQKYATAELPDKCVICKVDVATGEATDALKPSDVGFSDDSYDIRTPFVVSTPLGYKILIIVISWINPSMPYTEGVYYLSVDNGGAINYISIIQLVEPSTSVLVVDPVLSPDGDNLFLVTPLTARQALINFLYGVSNVVAGGNPISDSGPNWMWFYPRTCYTMNPRFSQDGKLGFFSRDMNCVFNETQWNVLDANFDINVFTVQDVITTDGYPTIYTIPSPGNQGPFAVSPGGTRLVYATFTDYTPENPSRLYLATLTITQDQELDDSSATVGDFTLADGSGTELFIPDQTVVNGLAKAGLLSITCYTPITPLEEVSLAVAGGVVLVRRSFSPGGITFVPPAGKNVTLTIHYTDAEVKGIDENSLTIAEASTAAKAPGGLLSTAATLEDPVIIERDPANNRIVASISGFTAPAKAGVGSEFVVVSYTTPIWSGPGVPTSTAVGLVALSVLLGAASFLVARRLTKKAQ
ncbi:MAG: hypothetical protein AAB358_00970 [Patescibacteria group bacterium]